MKKWLYKWLPIVFGCHCRDDRSFHYKGVRFPICARCTGELLGLIAGLLGFVWVRPGVYPWVLMLLPMIIDGVFQALTRYESRNLRRLWTGALFGYGLMSLFLLSSIYAYSFGVRLAEG